MRKLLAPAVLLGRTNLGQSLPLAQLGEQSGSAGKAVADNEDGDRDSSSETCTQTEEKMQSQKKKKARLGTASVSSPRRPPEVRINRHDARETGSHYPHTNAIHSISRETLLAAGPHRKRNDGTAGCHGGPENVRTFHSTVLGRRAVLGTQPYGSSETTAYPLGLASLAATHTQPATQSSDVGMLGGHVLATGATRSSANGTVRAPGVISLFKALGSAVNTTMRSGETCERRLPLLGAAKATPRKSQAKQNPTVRRRLPPGLLPLEWVGRSVSGNVECARSPTNLEFQVPTGVQCSAASCCGNWTGNSDPLPTSSLRRQRGHGSPISNVGCCSRGAWSQAKSMHR